ncbi:hypothetical protein NFI96_019526 [Prochilodus magdalenae]|nr:hypothetical protein NFI96_019526 [Prochilodus magdalenae]
MWGEIVEDNRQPVTFASYEAKTEEEDDKPVRGTDNSARDVVCAQASNFQVQEEPSSGLAAMMQAIVASGSPVKSQQLGEPDLTVEEKKEVLMEQYKAKPLVFLERYHAHMRPEHLEAFSHLSSDCRAQYYCTEVKKRASSSTNRTRVRNHRYAALRALQREGQYFSEEQMRFRQPLLYEQYIGQYLSEEEILQRSVEAMQKGPGGLADLLIDSYQEKQLQNRLQDEQDKEQCAEQEEEEDEEEGDGKIFTSKNMSFEFFTAVFEDSDFMWENDGSRQAEWEPTPEEKAMLREEFLSQMHQRFLDGKDKDFNYSEVDENPDYDNLDIVSHDAEERYFDEDDDEEEEEDGDIMD